MASPWLRLLSLWAAAAVLLAVVSGAAALGATHDVLSALALPPLTALVIGAWLRHRPLLPYALAALGLFGVAALVTAPAVHLALAAAALAAALVLAALVHREQWMPFGAVRDYVALTKPRIMSLLLVTGFCGLVAGAGGLPPWDVTIAAMIGLALACGGASALNHVLDRDIDKLMGKRTRKRPVAAERLSPEHALEFGLALSALSFTLLAGGGEPPDGRARPRGQPLLRARLHGLAQALDAAEHRHRRRGRRRATARRLGGSNRVARAAGARALPHRLPLDAAALLGARAAHQARLRGGGDSRCCPSCAVTPRRPGRSCSTPWRSWASPSCPFALGWFGAVYLAAALGLGAVFLWLAVRLRRSIQPARASALFHYSLLYLALIFVAAAIDPVVI